MSDFKGNQLSWIDVIYDERLGKELANKGLLNTYCVYHSEFK